MVLGFNLCHVDFFISILLRKCSELRSSQSLQFELDRIDAFREVFEVISVFAFGVSALTATELLGLLLNHDGWHFLLSRKFLFALTSRLISLPPFLDHRFKVLFTFFFYDDVL